MSKRLSATSSKRHKSLPTFFLDENLSSPAIATALKQFPHWNIELHTEHLARGAEDPDVLAYCGAKDWVLVSCDDRMRYVPKNKLAVIEYSMRLFLFSGGNHHSAQYAAAMIAGHRKILSIIRKTPGPFFARIQMSGGVALLPHTDPVVYAEKARAKTSEGA